MGVELASKVSSLNVDLGLVNETDDLDVVRRAHELNTLQGTLWDDTGATARLCTPGHLLALSVNEQATGTGQALGHHQPESLLSNIADVEDSGYDTEQIELFCNGKANSFQRVLKNFNQSSPERMEQPHHHHIAAVVIAP